MASNKKSFLLYCDLIHTINKLPNDKAGKLFKHILSYVNDENPTTDDLIISISFEPIKQQLKRDLNTWEGIKEERSINGREGNLKRWNKELYVLYKKGKYTLIEAENIAKSRKTSPPDKNTSPPIANIAVNDTVNVTVNDINKDIPEISNFMLYLKTDYLKNESERYEKVRTRMIDTYNAWKLNGWKDGNDKPIKNWKVKAINQLRYIK